MFWQLSVDIAEITNNKTNITSFDIIIFIRSVTEMCTVTLYGIYHNMLLCLQGLLQFCFF